MELPTIDKYLKEYDNNFKREYIHKTEIEFKEEERIMVSDLIEKLKQLELKYPESYLYTYHDVCFDLYVEETKEEYAKRRFLKDLEDYKISVIKNL
jgi:hypothetical protein